KSLTLHRTLEPAGQPRPAKIKKRSMASQPNYRVGWEADRGRAGFRIHGACDARVVRHRSAGSIRTQAVRPARARFLTQGRFRFPHERIGAAGSLHAIGPRQNGPGGKFKPRFRRKSLDISALSAERPD